MTHGNVIIRLVLAMAMTAAAAASVSPLRAEETYTLTIGDQGFQPSALDVRAGMKIRLTVLNSTKKPAEFESADLAREKVVPPGRSVTLSIGPLKAGSYKFFDDFDRSRHGTITAK